MTGGRKRRAVFLDRDGTIIQDVPYLFEPEKVRLIEGAGESIKRLHQMAFRVIVVTNQSGVARGYFKEENVIAVHDRLDTLLGYEGAKIDDYYYCPHEPDDNCKCRKPETQMVDEAVDKYSLDVENSYVIGDKSSDIWLGKKSGAISILVRTGLGLETEKEGSIKADFVARDILRAVEWIMVDTKRRY